jgi:hypothetical protein
MHQVCFVDDPVWCDVMQCGRCVQMFCEMTLCDVMQCGRCVQMFCEMTLYDVMQNGRYVQMFCEMTPCDVMACSMVDVYRCLVRTCCSVKWPTVQDLSILYCFILHLQQHLCENLTALRLCLTHEDWYIKFLQEHSLQPTRYTASLYIYSECHMSVSSFTCVATCMASCTALNSSYKVLTFRHSHAFDVDDSSLLGHFTIPSREQIPKFRGLQCPPTVQELLT